MYMQRTTSGAAGNGLYTTIKYMRGTSGIGMGTTIKHLRCMHNERRRGKRPGRNDEVPATHNERRREQWHEHPLHPPLWREMMSPSVLSRSSAVQALDMYFANLLHLM